MRSRRGSRLTLAAAVGQAVWAVLHRWQAVPAERRARLQALLRKSGGRPANLSASERREVGKILAELNPADMVRDIAQLTSRRR